MKKTILLLTLIASAIYVNGQQIQQAAPLQKNTHHGIRQAEQSLAITAKPENSNTLNQVKSLLCTDTIRYPQVKEQVLNVTPAFYTLPLYKDDNEEISQTFLHSGANMTIKGIEFFGNRNTTSTATVTMSASIFAVTAGYVPTGAALATGTVVVSSTVAGYKYVNFASPIVVTGNYAVVIKPTNIGGIFDIFVNNIAPGQPQDENFARFKSSYYLSSNGLWITTPQFTEIGNNHFEPLVAPIVSYTMNTTALAAPDPVCLGTPINFSKTATPATILASRMFNYNVFSQYFGLTPNDSTYVWSMGNLSPLIWSATTNYTYPAAGAYNSTVYVLGGFWNSCMDNAIDPLVVNALPVVTASATATTICSGSPTTLNQGGATSYIWNNGIGAVTSPTVSPSLTTTYTVTGTGPNSCTNTAQVTINVNALDNANFTYSSNTFCTSGGNETPAVFSPGTFSSSVGLVFVNATTGEINVSGSSNGTYSVNYVTNGSCPSSSNQSITISTVPDATFTYSTASLCTASANPSPIFTMGSSAGVFSSSAGLNFVSTSTGVIDLSTSTPSSYTVTNTIAAAGSCPMASATFNVTINTSPSAVVSGGGVACGDGSTPIAVNIALAGNGPWNITYSNGTSTSTLMNQSVTPVTINASTSGTYTVTSVSNANCTSTGTGSAAVTFNPNPTISITPVNALCDNGTAVQLNATPAGGVFSGTGVTAGFFDPAQAPSVYTITYNYTDANACFGTGTTNITVNQSPTVSLGAFTDVCLQSGAFTLSGGLPAGGTYSGTGVSTGMFNPTTSGTGMQTITYTYSDANTCSGTATETINVNDCAGIEEILASTVTISPNPASDQLFITYSATDGKSITWNMVSEDGKVVIASKVISVGTESINVSNLAKGVYFIQFNSENGQMTKKVMIH